MSHTNISLRTNNVTLDVISDNGESFLVEISNNGQRKTANISFKKEKPAPQLSPEQKDMIYTSFGYLKIIREVPEVNLKIRFAADFFEYVLSKSNIVKDYPDLQREIIKKCYEFKKQLAANPNYNHSERLLKACNKMLRTFNMPIELYDDKHEDRKDLMKTICDIKNVNYSDKLMDEYYKWSFAGGGKHFNRFKKMATFLDVKRV
jgi:hypothetical protein